MIWYNFCVWKWQTMTRVDRDWFTSGKHLGDEQKTSSRCNCQLKETWNLTLHSKTCALYLPAAAWQGIWLPVVWRGPSWTIGGGCQGLLEGWTEGCRRRQRREEPRNQNRNSATRWSSQALISCSVEHEVRRCWLKWTETRPGSSKKSDVCKSQHLQNYMPRLLKANKRWKLGQCSSDWIFIL